MATSQQDGLDPTGAQTPEAFMHLLREVRTQSGLSLVEVAERARERGYDLDPVSLNQALGKPILPNWQVVTGVLAACGMGGMQIDRWIRVYHDLGAPAEPVVPVVPRAAVQKPVIPKPRTEKPTVQMPIVKPPEAQAPAVQVPEVQALEAQVPAGQVPAVQAPAVQAAQAATAQAPTPETPDTQPPDTHPSDAHPSDAHSPDTHPAKAPGAKTPNAVAEEPRGLDLMGLDLMGLDSMGLEPVSVPPLVLSTASATRARLGTRHFAIAGGVLVALILLPLLAFALVSNEPDNVATQATSPTPRTIEIPLAPTDTPSAEPSPTETAVLPSPTPPPKPSPKVSPRPSPPAPSPSPSLPAEPAVLRSGVVALTGGQSVDLDSGQGARDIWRRNGITLERLNGSRLVAMPSTPSKGTCQAEQGYLTSVTNLQPGQWLCVRTSDSRYGRINITATGDTLKLAFTVWV